MKETRNQKFQKAIEVYFKNSILFFWNDIEWDCCLNTENQRLEIHDYTLTIPFKVNYTQYGYYDANGEYHAEYIQTRKQKIPHLTKIKKDFNNYFYDYILFDGLIEVSYVKLYSSLRNEEGIKLSIKVKYHKGYIPYSIEQLNNNGLYFYRYVSEQENTLQNLNQDIIHQESIINDLSTSVYLKRKDNIKMLGQIERMKTLFIEMYVNNGKYEECPICYETIDGLNIYVSNCSHLLCKNCFKKCSFCPICRDDYNKKNNELNQIFGEDDDLEEGEIFEEAS